MPEPQKCPECGAELPPDGVCVPCALRAARDLPDEVPPTPPPNPTVRVSPPADQPADQPGEKIGPYKLLQLIGEGGMGSVWLAEQRQPIFREVAIKLIKLGMDTKEVVGRFEAERQALAMMDHPNIAKIIEAGTTENGRPYFVMERVRGIPITEFCNEHKLTTRERLELFIPVCQAIQHAHSKLIVHRDLKPSNILVGLGDQGKPVPKIIDFGIAKALGQFRLTDKSLSAERLGGFIGTWLYMSPEQALLSALDIDTCTDIYSLGVVLYELLTGKTPFDAQQLREAGLDEIRRVIREEDPPRPSTKLTTLPPDEQTAAAKRRQTEPLKLRSIIRGDLDWIVMKCLEKDRRRRYETANGLAMDIERHLSNEPVVARPPSNLYRLQKLVRRNKLAFAAGTSVIAALVLGMGTASWMYLRESQARQRALEAERTQAHLREQADRASEIANENAQRAQKALDNALRSGDRAVIDGAVEDYKAFVQQSADNSSLRAKLAGLYQLQAEVYWKRSQDGTLGSEQRENARAIATAAIQESCRLLEELTQTFPKNAQHAESLADGHALFARLADTENQTFHLGKALGLLELLNKQQPDAWRLQLKLANLLRQSAEYSSDPEELRRFARAELDYRERTHLRAHQEETDGVVMDQLAEELSLTYEAAARLHENESEAGIYAEKAARIFRTLMAQRETNGLAADMAAGLLRLASLDRQWVAVLQQRGALGEAAKAGRQWILDLERHQAHDEDAAARMIEEAYSAIAPLFETLSISASDRIALTARLGKEATIEGTISEAVWSSTGYVLNIDFEGTERLPMKQRFLAVVFKQDSDSIASVLGGEVATVLTGRLVRLQGRLQRYGGRVASWAGRPQIVVAEPRQIALIRTSSATPALPEPPYPEPSRIIHAGTPIHSAETTQVSAGSSSEALKAADVERLKAAIGKEVVVEGTIQTAEWSGSGAVMNIQFEGAPDGLLAAIFQRDAPNISRGLGGDPERILPGKTVQVRGRLETYGGKSPRFTDRPQIIIRDATQIVMPKDGGSQGDAADQPADAAASSEVLKAADVERLKAAIGKEVVVEGTIQSAEWSGSGAVMNIQFEGAPDGLLAAIFQRDAPNISRGLGGDPERILPGKTVQVRGRLETYGGKSFRFTDRLQIIIRDATQIVMPKDGGSQGDAADRPADAAVSSEVLKAADVERLKAAIGREVVVEGTIQTAEWSGSGAVMNIQFEGAPDGLLAAIFQRDAHNLSRALGGDLERILPGKTVQVRGQVETYGGKSPRFTDRPQIIIRKGTQFEMRKKTGSP